MSKVYIVIQEFMTTDGEFGAEAYVEYSAQEAGEYCTSLIANMAEEHGMDINEINPMATRELKGDGWFYRVRVEEQEFLDFEIPSRSN